MFFAFLFLYSFPLFYNGNVGHEAIIRTDNTVRRGYICWDQRAGICRVMDVVLKPMMSLFCLGLTNKNRQQYPREKRHAKAP